MKGNEEQRDGRSKRSKWRRDTRNSWPVIMRQPPKSQRALNPVLKGLSAKEPMHVVPARQTNVQSDVLDL